MSSSTTTQTALKPIFTRDLLNNLEASMSLDPEYFQLETIDGKIIKSKNLQRGLGTADLAPRAQERRNIIGFQDERSLKRREAEGKLDQFVPLFNASAVFHGPSKTLEETRATFAEITQHFGVSDEAEAIADMVRTHLKGCAVDKVIGFGLGRIGSAFIRQQGFVPPQTFYEHAAAKVVWEAVKEVSSAPKVDLLVQDPMYTDVCKDVLREARFDIIGGFGAKGFCLVDDNTIVLAHHPSFPFREIICDLARPAMICMKAQENGSTQPPVPDLRWDVDSVRSRKMIEEYRGISLPFKKAAFWDNTWYVRNTSANPSTSQKSR